jgi:hypothetical protein
MRETFITVSFVPHSALMPAALMMDHHFSISAFWLSINATQNYCGAGGGSWPLADTPVSRCRGSFQG